MPKLTTGATLRKWRLEHNLSQKDLAKKLRVTQPDISRWEGLKRLPASAQTALRKLKLSNKKKKKKKRVKKLIRTKKRKLRLVKTVKTDLKSVRKHLGLSQPEMAEILATYQSAISSIEHGRMKLPKRMIPILKLLSTSRAPRRKKKKKGLSKRAVGQMTGKRLKAIRTKLDLTQAELADRLKTHQSKISSEENSTAILKSLEIKVLALLKRSNKRRTKKKRRRREHRT